MKESEAYITVHIGRINDFRLNLIFLMARLIGPEHSLVEWLWNLLKPICLKVNEEDLWQPVKWSEMLSVRGAWPNDESAHER